MFSVYAFCSLKIYSHTTSLFSSKNHNRDKWNDDQGLLRKAHCFFHSVDGIYKTSRPSDKITLPKLWRRLFIHHIITVSSDLHCLIKIPLEARVIGLFTWPRASYNGYTIKNYDFPFSTTINCHKPFTGGRR